MFENTKEEGASHPVRTDLKLLALGVRTDISIMIHPDQPPETRMTWGLNACQWTRGVLSPVVVVYVAPDASTICSLYNWGWGPIKRLIKK